MKRRLLHRAWRSGEPRQHLRARHEHVRQGFVAVDIEEKIAAQRVHGVPNRQHFRDCARRPAPSIRDSGSRRPRSCAGCQARCHRDSCSARCETPRARRPARATGIARPVAPPGQPFDQPFHEPFGHGFARMLARDDPDVSSSAQVLCDLRRRLQLRLHRLQASPSVTSAIGRPCTVLANFRERGVRHLLDRAQEYLRAALPLYGSK